MGLSLKAITVVVPFNRDYGEINYLPLHSLSTLKASFNGRAVFNPSLPNQSLAHFFNICLHLLSPSIPYSQSSVKRNPFFLRTW